LLSFFSPSEKLIPNRICLKKVRGFPEEGGGVYAVGKAPQELFLLFEEGRGSVTGCHGWQLAAGLLSPPPVLPLRSWSPYLCAEVTALT